NTPAGRQSMDSVVIGLPIVGPLLQKIEIARFSQTLATLLENGVVILEALRLATETVGNRLIQNELSACYTEVKGGARLSSTLSQSRAIPPLVVQMIAVGEE